MINRSQLSLIAVCLILICAITIGFVGCSHSISAVNIMEDITPVNVTAIDSLNTQNDKITDLAIKLLMELKEDGENTLISPISIIYALAMTANGASGETLLQMEATLGMSLDELNLYLYSYVSTLPRNEKYKLNIANSIWFTDDESFEIKPEFLKSIATYYSGEAYKAPFNQQTCRDINKWVSRKTDGKINNMLDKVSHDAIMYLINALSFDAEWDKVYNKESVIKGKFTKEDGSVQDCAFMYSNEGVYLKDEKASGFIKYYKDKKYAFVAMLPDNGVSVSGYLSYLMESQSLGKLLSRKNEVSVHAAIPKFDTEYSEELSQPLSRLGMPLAFDPHNADFSGLGTCSDGNIYISKIIHKTFISISEKGTQAGASTVVEMQKSSIMQSETVYLDRPFVYMIIDCENNIPVFIGTMMDLEG